MGSVAKDVSVSLGMVSAIVRIESAKYSEDSLTNVCLGTAETHEPVAVTRPLTCDVCGPIGMFGLKKARKENGGLVILEDSELETLKGNDLEFKGKVNLVPYDMQEVMNCTGTGDKQYQLHPQHNADNYALLAQVIAAYPNRAFVARYTVRTKASLFVASVNGSCIMLNEREFQTNLKPVPSFETEANASFVPLVIQMVEAMGSTFNAKTFADQYTIDLDNMTRERPIIGGKTATTSPVAKKLTDDLVRNALMEYRARKMADVASDV